MRASCARARAVKCRLLYVAAQNNMPLDYARFAGVGVDDEEAEEQLRRADLDAKKEFVAKSRPRADSESSTESDLDDNPLFWRVPPSQRKNPSKRALELEEMFQRMVYDDRNADNLAEDFRERGNQAFRMGQLDEAESLFAEALEWARVVEDKTRGQAHAALVLSNRAQLHLKRGNNRSALRDAQAALHADPASVKARFRAIKAALALGKTLVALALLKGHEDDAALAPLADETKKAVARAQAQARSDERKVYAQRKADADLRALLRSRPIRFGSGDASRDGAPAKQADGSLAWPLVLLYPEHSQSDFVQAVHETSAVDDVLALVFADSPPWDASRHYTLDALDVYFCERAAVALDLARPLFEQAPLRDADDADAHEAKRWVRVPRTVTLAQVLAHPLYVIPGVATLVVVSRRSAAFFDTFAAQMRHSGGVLDDFAAR